MYENMLMVFTSYKFYLLEFKELHTELLFKNLFKIIQFLKIDFSETYSLGFKHLSQ